MRIRRGLRQADVAAAAGCSRPQISRLERGEIERTPVEHLQAVAAVLGADLDLRVRWHGEGLDRLLDEAHANLVDAMVQRLTDAGWECAVEVTFSVYGERGSIDVFARHPANDALLVSEIKSTIPDAGSTISTHDRKVRLAPGIAGERGWAARIVGRLLVVADSTTSRRRVRQLDAVFGAAYPDRGAAVDRWIRSPAGPLSGLLFLPDSLPDSIRRPAAGRSRVSRPKGAAKGSETARNRG